MQNKSIHCSVIVLWDCASLALLRQSSLAASNACQMRLAKEKSSNQLIAHKRLLAQENEFLSHHTLRHVCTRHPYVDPLSACVDACYQLQFTGIGLPQNTSTNSFHSLSDSSRGEGWGNKFVVILYQGYI